MRYALRLLAHGPGYAMITAAVLAIGIGANMRHDRGGGTARQ